MMKQDRFLTAIVAGTVVLALAALVVFFTRQKQPAYLPEGTPEGVVNNYAAALYQQDYQKAYAYLADGESKPGYEAFRQLFMSKQMDPSNSALQIESASIEGNEAMVFLSVISSWGGPFSSTSRSPDTAYLVEQDGAWKINRMPYPYWGWEWYQPQTEALPYK